MFVGTKLHTAFTKQTLGQILKTRSVLQGKRIPKENSYTHWSCLSLEWIL